MNFEKIINYFRRLGQTIRTKFAGSRSKRGDKSFKERKATTGSKWNRKQARKSPKIIYYFFKIHRNTSKPIITNFDKACIGLLSFGIMVQNILYWRIS